jgi:hypothetical protein
MTDQVVKEYHIVAVKATRAAVVLGTETDYSAAVETADHYYRVYCALSRNQLASTGVSFRVYDYLPVGVEIGDPDFVLGKPAVMSWGGV